MKLKNIILSVIALMLSGIFCQATTLIVDSHYPRPAGVYATIQLAYNAASAGDTILISPASGEYAGITIAKRINIIGTGWINASPSVPHAKTSGFTFNAGAQGSSITGLDVNGMSDINTDSITLKRNKLQYIWVRANSTNIVIQQNHIQGSRTDCCNWQNSTVINILENSEVFISNNVIINTYYGSYTQYGIATSYPVNLIVCNNVIKAEDTSISIAMSGGNYSSHAVYNNIVLGGSLYGITVDYDCNNHNIGNTTQFGTINNNQQNVDMNTVFVDAANNNYHLKEGSPAIGAGVGGTDCGIYGGNHPFVDNGRTWLPMITEMTVPTEVNVKDGLNVTVKAKSGK